MYTRSYQKDKKPIERIEKEELLNPHEELNEAIPAGYCGTAILRENAEKPQEIFGEHGLPRQPLRRVRHLKMSKKSMNDEDADCSENTFFENEDHAMPCCEQSPTKSKDRDSKKHSFDCNFCEQPEEEESDCCENTTPRPQSCNKEISCSKRLRDRSFSVEDLLLGGLILLMLNEGVDDDIILIFGFLLLSGL